MNRALRQRAPKRDINNLPDDIEQIKDMLEDIDREVMDISQQITDYFDADEDDLDEDDHNWLIRAEDARRWRYRIAARLKRKLRDASLSAIPKKMAAIEQNRVEAASRMVQARQLAAENLAKQEAIHRESQATKARIKAMNIAAANDRTRQQYRLVLDHLKVSHPDVWQEVIALLQADDAKGRDAA